MRIIVIGIGQTMRGDDAAGVEAVRRWQQKFPDTASRSEISVEFSELPGLALLDLLGGFDDVLIVDAVQSGAAPGTVHRLSPKDLASFGTESKSAHGWGVAETLELGRQLQLIVANPSIRLIGVEAQELELGQPMSEAVEESLPAVCQAIEDELTAFLK